MTKRKNLMTELAGRKAVPLPKDEFEVDFSVGSGSIVAGALAPKGSSYSGHTGAFGGGQRCYHTHPALKLPGSDHVIYGGSCLDPAVKDADIYIGFDSGMKLSDKAYPWNRVPGKEEVLFRITDMAAPKDHAEFKKLVEWTKEQLAAGKKVHAGCIGGHGRTGLFFSALVSTYGEPDAISYVRKNYCNRAVESGEQVAFLGKHFGVKSASGSKSGGSKHDSHSHSKEKTPWVSSNEKQFSPIKSSLCIWG